MIKTVMISVSLLISTAVFSEANISQEDAAKTILLTAPGTISGIVRQPGSDSSSSATVPGASNSAAVPDTTIKQPPQRYNYPFFNYIEERDYKFPQYGQVNGRNNPWSESESEPNRRLPPPLPPARGFSSNPWDLSGRDILAPSPNRAPSQGYRPPRYSNTPSMSMMPNFGGFDDMLPNYADGIYRDRNPASMGPFMNGFMPGLDNNDSFDFPFSPFNMF